MSSYKNFSEEKKALLNALTDIKLPIVITGKLGSGKSSVGQYLKDNCGKGLMDITHSNIEDSFINSERFADNMINFATGVLAPSGFVIVDCHPSFQTILMPIIGDHINVKCFRGKEDAEPYFHIALAKADIKLTDELSDSCRVEVIPDYNMEGYKHSYINTLECKQLYIDSAKSVGDIFKTVNALESLKQIMSDSFIEPVPVCFKINAKYLDNTTVYYLSDCIAKSRELGLYFVFHYETNEELKLIELATDKLREENLA